jgi:hypothetical protein
LMIPTSSGASARTSSRVHIGPPEGPLMISAKPSNGSRWSSGT